MNRYYIFDCAEETGYILCLTCPAFFANLISRIYSRIRNSFCDYGTSPEGI